MTCFIAQNELSAFADDALEAARAAELQSHLTGCADCTRELQEIRRIRTMLRTLPVHRAPRDFLAKVNAKAQRKSLFERAAAAISPLLQLPRPAQAGLALAASLLIAVTVFWNNPDPSLSGLRSAPGGSDEFSEVVNVEAPSLARQEESSRDGVEADDERKQDLLQERQAAAGDQKPMEKRVAEAAPPPPGADPVPADSGAKKARVARNEVAAESTPAPALALRAAPTPDTVGGGRTGDVAGRGTTGLGSASRGTSGSGAGASSSISSGASSADSGYVAPTSAGLYASDPQGAGAPARPKTEVAKVAAAPAPAKESPSITATGATKSRAVDETAPSEPAFDSSMAFGQSSSSAASDDWGGVPGSAAVGEKTKAKDQSDKKDVARRDRGLAGAQAVSEPAAASPAPNAGEESISLDDQDASAERESVVAAALSTPAPAAATVSAKYLSASPSAPAEVVRAAKAAGGRLVSPASAPPGLGKAGASTVVIVEIPESGVAAFEDALRASGTLERASLPSGAVRFRIEVVRQ